jgi:hypothetical protein
MEGVYMEEANIIKWSKVSELLSGSPRALNSNRIPIKHSAAVLELQQLVSKWVDKHKKADN